MARNEEDTEEWMHIHRTLLAIAERRADLDAKEAFWLREAIARKIWQPLGMVSIYDYMERVLEHRPQTARERLRVAEALGELPQLAQALATGQLRYSAVKELTRVANPETEGEWIDAAAGKPVRAIEKLVRGHHRGDRPSDPVDPDCGPHELRFEVSADVYALLRQARHVLDERAGRRLDDDELLATLANAALDGHAATTDEAAGASARYQIGLTVCERCGQGSQIGAGVEVPVSAATVERAHCDAQHIGRIDAPIPERAYRDVSPAVARLVHHRDHGCCRNPGCRSSLGIEIHHIVARAQGGSHVPSNLVLVCFSCHKSHHEGRLRIHGTADALLVDRVEVAPHAGAIELPRSALGVADDAHFDVGTSPAVDLAGSSSRSHVGAAAGSHDPGSDAAVVEQSRSPVGAASTLAGSHDPGTAVAEHSRSPVGAASTLAGSHDPRPGNAATEHSHSHVGAAAGSHDPGSDAAVAEHSRSHVGAAAGSRDPGSDNAAAEHSRSHVGAASTLAGSNTAAAAHSRSHVGAAGTLAASDDPGSDNAASDIGGLYSRPHVGAASSESPSRIDRAILRSQARDALVSLGWTRGVVARAVDTALQRLPVTAPLQRVLFEALRQCPRR